MNKRQITDLTQEAEQGDIEAQYVLGFLYQYALGVPTDHEKGIHWIRQSAEQGHPEAQSDLGYAYAHGIGVPRDLTQAYAWYILAQTTEELSESDEEQMANLREELSPSEINEAHNRAIKLHEEIQANRPDN